VAHRDNGKQMLNFSEWLGSIATNLSTLRNETGNPCEDFDTRSPIAGDKPWQWPEIPVAWKSRPRGE